MEIRFEFINASAICDETVQATYGILRTYGIAGEKKIGELYIYDDNSPRSIELYKGYPHSLAEITAIVNADVNAVINY